MEKEAAEVSAPATRKADDDDEDNRDMALSGYL